MTAALSMRRRFGAAAILSCFVAASLLNGISVLAAPAPSTINTDRNLYVSSRAVSLHGTGFDADAPITITISGDDPIVGRTIETLSDEQGTFDAGFTADPEGNLGRHQVSATDGTATALGKYEVVSTAIETDVDTYPSGDTAYLTGEGFTVGADVSITITDPLGGPRFVAATVASDGTVAASFAAANGLGTLGQYAVSANDGSKTAGTTYAVVIDPPPFDGNPISPGLGPTYGEAWCASAAAGSSIAGQQSAPLALIPYEAFGCTLAKFKVEEAAAGITSERLTYSKIATSAGGRDVYGAVINDLETADQVRDYNRYLTVRAMELTDPAGAQALLNSYGSDIKMPIFFENNIHGDEEEGADALMQVIRDLVTLPRGTNTYVDEMLDHAILITVPTINPDGRFIGTRANAFAFDMNRDWLVQSQSEVIAERALIQQWMPTVGSATHGYVNPTLIDGVTKPHNPGLEYDIYLKWNQRRLDANTAALTAAGGMGHTRPINFQCPDGANRSSVVTCATSTIATAANLGLSEAGNVVTVTTTAANIVKSGGNVTISGTHTPAATGYDGTFQVAGVISTTKFTYTNPTAGLVTSGGGSVAILSGPSQAEGWDDWGPFYTQTYLAYLGSDSSTSEMCSSGTGCNGRFGSKKAQYVGFWSSVDYWVNHRHDMMFDQLEIFRRGVTDAARVNCCDDVFLQTRGITEPEQNWMIPFPKAYIIPFDGGGQRSNAEANRLVQWMLDNGIQVSKMTAPFTWNSVTYPAGSYVVWMNQALRGLALTALSAGQDISARITQLYAPPGAWSHGTLWGADTVEVPRGDGTFTPTTTTIGAPSITVGGIRGGVGAASDWYSVTLRGWHDFQTIQGLLHAGVLGEIAEASFNSTTGGPSPAGTLIFPNDANTRAALDAAGQAGVLWFERNVGVTKPATTLMTRAPRVAILVNNANPAESAQTFSLRRIFGTDARFLSVTTSCPTCAETSINTALTDPLLNYDIIFNTGQAWPAGATARTRLNTFFGRGGGYIASGASTTNFSFLTGATNNTGTAAALTTPMTQGSSSAFGEDVLWTNVGGSASPVTGGYPSQDHLFLAQNVQYFATKPATATVDGQYLADMAGAGGGNGPNAGFVAGLWRNRAAATNNAAILIHGLTTISGADRPNPSRYCGLASDPFGTRSDGERIWAWVTQCALWTNLTDETKLNQTITFVQPTTPATYGSTFNVNPTSSSGLSVGLVTAGGCTAAPAISGYDVTMTSGTTACDLTASQPGNADYNPATDVLRTVAAQFANQIITFTQPATPATYGTTFNVTPTASSGLPVSLVATGGCTSAPAITGYDVTMTSGTTSCTLTASQAGNANYNAAVDVQRIVAAQKANQTITFAAIPTHTYLDADFGIAPTASSTLTASLSPAGQCTVTSPTSPANVHITAAGSCSITASQAGDANYNAAPNVIRTFTIYKASQTITFAAIPTKSYLDANFGIVPTTTSPLTVAVSALGDCTVSPATSPSIVHIVQAGSCTITASQAGDSNYKPATSVLRTFTINQASLNSLGSVSTWIGLKNSDDIGTSFDVKVELLKNNVVIETGLTRCITSVPRMPSALHVTLPWQFVAATVNKGDVLSLKVSTRIGTVGNDATKCAGHNNAIGLRLYYDWSSQDSLFTGTMGSVPTVFTKHLRSNGNVCNNAASTNVTIKNLDDLAPGATPGPKCRDSIGVNFSGGNLWQVVDTWGNWTLP